MALGIPAEFPFRRSERIDTEIKVRVKEPGHPGYAEASLRDLSVHGVFLSGMNELSEGDTVRIGLPLSEDELWTCARVMWRGAKDASQGVGIQLVFEKLASYQKWRDSVGQRVL